MDSGLVVDFVNTIDRRPGEEKLATPAGLRDWLAGRNLLGARARVSADDLEDAVRLREALRDLLAVKSGLDADAARAGAEVERAAQRAGLGLRLDGGLARLEPSAGGVPGALGRIVAEVSVGMTDGTWDRMKACRADDCRWAFLDTAKNRSRAWCSMEDCGNREKARAFRARQAR
jgi:predicted RNA-binding Zn ribbon-like protein